MRATYVVNWLATIQWEWAPPTDRSTKRPTQALIQTNQSQSYVFTGLSDKPLTEYNAEVWRAQLAAFLQEVVGVGGPMGASIHFPLSLFCHVHAEGLVRSRSLRACVWSRETGARCQEGRPSPQAPTHALPSTNTQTNHQTKTTGGAKAIVVGNSLGGYTALATAAFHPELVHSCAVLNGAGACVLLCDATCH